MDVGERESWLEADRLFQQLLDLDTAARQDWLEKQALEEGVRARLEHLLACAERPHRLLDAAVFPSADAPQLLASAGAKFSLVGQRIGDWQLCELIGEGGMGTVYRAARVGQDFEQQAAVKLLARTIHGAAARARFQRERRILAQLQHPHIAGLIDAGVAADGTPYLAMTLLHGTRIDQHCQARALSLNARVELVLQVCAAVAYAHRQLVVHRDIKPANILVDASGHATLLDFGIAHLLDVGDAAERTLTRAFTPDYAAPEQSHGDHAPGTAVDVYGLGAVLHRLLAGAPPQRDAHGDPRPASKVAAAQGQAQAASLRGDLDALFACALANDPQERYASVDLLAADLRAWLQRRPLQARRAGACRRMGKFVQRHRAASALALLAALALAAGSVQFALSHRALERHAAELQAVTQFQADMLEQIVPAEVGARLRAALRAALPTQAQAGHAASTAIDGIDYTGLAVDMLDEAILARAADAARTRFADQPRIAAMLLQQVASSYRGLGRFASAGVLQDEVIAKLEQEPGDADRLTLAARREQLKLLRMTGAADGEARHRAVLEAHRYYLGANDLDTQVARAALGQWLMTHGKAAEAEPLLREAVARFDRASGAADADAAAARVNLAFSVSSQGRYAESEPGHRRAVEDAVRVFGPGHEFTLVAINNLAYVLGRTGHDDEAEQLYTEVYAARRQSLGATHPATLVALNNRASALRKRGQAGAALVLQEQAYTGLQAVLGPAHATTLKVGASLAAAHVELRQFEQAASLLTDILARARDAGAPSALVKAQLLLGRCRAGQGRPDEADRIYEQAWQDALQTGRAADQREVASWAARLDQARESGAARHALWLQRERGVAEPLAASATRQ